MLQCYRIKSIVQCTVYSTTAAVLQLVSNGAIWCILLFKVRCICVNYVKFTAVFSFPVGDLNILCFTQTRPLIPSNGAKEIGYSATSLQDTNVAQIIVKETKQTDNNDMFISEKYSYVLENGKSNTPSTKEAEKPH